VQWDKEFVSANSRAGGCNGIRSLFGKLQATGKAPVLAGAGEGGCHGGYKGVEEQLGMR
jgi:hypothetical protein